MLIARLARLVASSSVTVLLGSVLVAACGGAPGEESSETSEALGKPVCPSWGCGANPIPPAPTCSTWPRPRDTEGYTSVWLHGPGLDCYLDPTFSADMTAFGCMPEFYYQADSQATPEGGLIIPVALCPGVPKYTTPIATDSCTGEAPSGWSFVTWWYYPTCDQPGAGCHSGACMTF